MLLKTLHGKLSLILLGLLFLIGCLAVPLTLFTTEKYQQESAQTLNRSLAASLASHLAEQNLLSQNPAVLQEARAEIKSLMVINPNIDVYLLDAQGNVLAYSGAPDAVKQSRVSLTPLRRFLGKSTNLPILGDNPRIFGRQEAFSVAPFPAASSPAASFPAGSRSLPVQGYVYVILNGEHYAPAGSLLRRSDILQSSVFLLIIILALVALAGLLLFRLLTRRLRHLIAAIEVIRDRGYLEPEAALPARLFTPWPGGTLPRDEIDRLGTVYLQMSGRIRQQIEELAQADTHRREMVSNVSHDLRTPLAALQGYLETLLIKGESLVPQEQQEYLQIALRHAERLAKLVSELFELARLDSREVSLHPEPFSLSELVQDVVQQHQLAAEQGHLILQAVLPENLPFVYADIAMIERVVVNLLDNALRYTPPGGTVTIILALQAGKIEVRVADTGSGIPQEHLPYIFERFYRVPSQPEKPGCAGLGLAIAKRILEIHGSAIIVESVPDAGTVFTFHLPLYNAS